MSRVLRSGLFALLAVCALRSPAGAATTTAGEVVARYVAARGGAAAIAAIQTLVMRGTYTEGSYSDSHAYMARMRPNLRLVGDPHDNPDVMEGFDNAAWEYYATPGIVLRTTGPAENASRRGAEFDDPLVNYRAKGHVVEYAGIDAILGRPAYRLHVTLNDGQELDKFIDVERGLLVAERRNVPQHAFGPSVATQTLIGDYVTVDGVRFATTYREAEIEGGKVLNELKWRSIEANVRLDASYFAPPVLERTPLQRLLQTLYDDRYDATVALGAYRAFRSDAATASINTEQGVEFVAYQCVKMAAYATAVALLHANAADYPNSAAAQFGLGRALQAAAEPDAALTAYRRALELDPTEKRARAAIASLAARAP